MTLLRLLSAPLLMACAAEVGDGPDTDTDTDTTPPCDLPAGEVRILADGYANGTEGAAFSPDGRLLITARERAVELDRNGGVVAEWSTPGTIGTMWWDGAFWVTVGEDDQGGDAPALLEIRGDQTTLHPLSGLQSPNFVVGTPWGTVLIAVPTLKDELDKIYEWDPGSGATTVWSDDVESPNGLAFSADGSRLYAATTFSDEGLWEILVADGKAGAVRRIVPFAAGTFPDGIAMEADGSVLVALNGAGRIDRVTPDGQVQAVADTPWAASIAHGTAGWPACSAVVTSLFSPEVFLVGTGAPGAPVP